MAKITVLGCGYGTSLAVIFDKFGHDVTAWSAFDEEIETIKRDHEHKKLLPGVPISDTIKLTTDIKCVSGADILIFAIPSKFVHSVATQVKPYVDKKTVIVNGGKGFEEVTCKRLSQVLEGEFPENDVAVMTGPSHAEEIGRLVPTTIVVSCKNKNAAEYVQEQLTNERLRIYVNDDVAGCELGGALKNPIALCCGIVEGMGLGDNTLAAVMTRGIAEITRLGVKLGANWKTFTGLTGIGDLIVTCTSKHSRNHRAGVLIGQGVPVEEAIARTGTVEGYGCVKIAVKLAADNGVETPIMNELYKVCYENQKPQDGVRNLMGRPIRHESEKFWLD